MVQTDEEQNGEKFSNMLSDFRAIIRRGKKSNTYKFVLARSILEFVKNNESEIKKNIDERKIPMTQIMRDEALKAFELWNKKIDKVKY